MVASRNLPTMHTVSLKTGDAADDGIERYDRGWIARFAGGAYVCDSAETIGGDFACGAKKRLWRRLQLVGQRMKLVIEPSSAVALAPLLRGGGSAGVEPKSEEGKAGGEDWDHYFGWEMCRGGVGSDRSYSHLTF